jgi:pimeloyl-ACP methyl ester carboxylesterase
MELVFVHGAFVRDGPWWWQPTATPLEERTGVRSRSIALPSCGETGERGGLEADAEALRAVLDELDDAVLVGHSYGGTVIAEAGRHPAVRHLVLVSSYLPEIGQAQAQIMSGEPDPVAVADAGSGLVAVAGYDAVRFGARFLQDADDAVQRQAWERVTAQSVAALGTPTTAAGWRGVDSTALVCTADRSTSVGLQREHAGRASRSVDLPTGHHPFITRPDLVVGVLAPLVA